jgi:hypothetical protein
MAPKQSGSESIERLIARSNHLQARSLELMSAASDLSDRLIEVCRDSDDLLAKLRSRATGEDDL